MLVYDPDRPDFTNHAEVVVHTRVTDLLAMLTGGNRVHSLSSDLVLDGSGSHDPSNINRKQQLDYVFTR